MSSNDHRNDDPIESKDYRKLVADLKCIIEDARSKGIDLTQRMDTLACTTCGAYEELTAHGHWLVVDPVKLTVSMQQFLIIDLQQKTFQRKQVRYFKTAYTFICPACGTYQNAVVRDRFPA